MSCFIFYELFLLSLLLCAAKCIEEECPATNMDTMKLSIELIRNSTGNWNPTAAQLLNMNARAKYITVDIEHSTDICGTALLHKITSFIREDDIHPNDAPERNVPTPPLSALAFDKTHHGNTTSILDNGKTAFKKKAWGFGAAFTSRPLNEDEIFEVTVIKGSIFIGVTTIPPSMIEIYKFMKNHRKETCSLDVSRGILYCGGAAIKNNYGKISIKDGDKLGVSRKNDGSLHFIHNGKDLGTAINYINYPLYGFIDLLQPLTKATIVTGTR